ncbi:MAG TPA: four helix bundle protein [Fibrobacteria bacterium]|nr:four helix bundle protein [Fibrobacteria bacterium]
MSDFTKGYKELMVWQISMELVPQIYRMTKRFPSDELYGITSQIRRAVVSVPANIAEGQARRHPKEFLNFLSIARGSLAEVDTLMMTSIKLGYLDETAMNKIEPQVILIRKLLQKLMQSIMGPNEKGQSGGGYSTPDSRLPTPGSQRPTPDGMHP